MRLLFKIVVSLLALGASSLALASSLEQASQNLMGPTEILTKLVVVACYIVGVALIIFALAQYRQHRQSPKLVPLSTPIILLILGIVAVLIPYISVLSGQSFSAVERAKEEGQTPDKSGALPPLPQPQQKKFTGPGRYTPAEPSDSQELQQDEEYDQNYDDSDNGSWTNDPRYNR